MFGPRKGWTHTKPAMNKCCLGQLWTCKMPRLQTSFRHTMSPTWYFWLSPPAALVTENRSALPSQFSHSILLTNHGFYAKQLTDSSSKCHQIHGVTFVETINVNMLCL